MTSDPNKKSLRQFQSRDVLWESFEQMARELECSVDYLINEAMKQYARQRSLAGRTPAPVGMRPPEASLPPVALPAEAPRAPASKPRAAPPSRVVPPPPPPRAQIPPAPTRLAAPPPQSRTAVPQPTPLAPRTAPPPPVPSAGRSLPPPLPRHPTPVPPPASSAPTSSTLFVVYDGEKFPVNKDRFVIGRGKQTSDLMVKDPNVSRQHAMVECQKGMYFMVDMGSTNGVEFAGQRIARKPIAEGDTFRICDHEISFTYR